MTVKLFGHLLKELELFLYRSRKRIFSRQSWVILCKPVAEEDVVVPTNDFRIREASKADLGNIAYALPNELARPLSHVRRLRLVSGRFKAGVPCFVAFDKQGGEVVGACWCQPLTDQPRLLSLLPGWSDVFEISTLFVTPAARGKNIGSVLVSAACDAMSAKGFQGCVSLVWYTRQPSIKSHLKIGFRPVGEKVTLSVFGFRKTWFRDSYQARLLPYYREQSS